MPGAEVKNFQSPDETRTFQNGRAEVLQIGGGAVGRFTFEPGWRWSEHVKPIAQTDSCQTNHFAYHASGRLHVRMDDGTEFDIEPGTVGLVPAGHDAWVIGNESVVMIDWGGATNYARG